MKLLPAELSYLATAREGRRNLVALSKFLGLMAAMVGVYTAIFHWIMLQVEGVRHSWITGFYWTLTVMTTLGFGDITFQSNIGRAFTIVVLLSGVVFFVIVMPVAFISYFYAPWLEARIRQRAPRAAPARLARHVILCRYDEVTRLVLERLASLGIPGLVIEPDPATAATLHSDGVPVMVGELDAVETYAAAGVARARAVVANLDDATNTNITLTAREAAPEATILAIVDEDDAIDNLQLAGATHVLPLKRQLGEHLASRMSAGRAHAHVIGRFKDLRIAELPVHLTPLARKSVRDTRLREEFGVNVVGVWERGRLQLASPDTVLDEESVAVVAGSAEQMTRLDTYLHGYDVNVDPVLVIGGGRVGVAAARALAHHQVPVHVVEKDASLERRLATVADKVFIGDAADHQVLRDAGLGPARSVLLSTHDDATNIYLAVYLRRLDPDVRIVSRITHERNLESIHRAGADLVLSYSGLAVEAITAALQGRELVLLGEGIELFTLPVPAGLEGKALGESGVAERTGLNVIAIDGGDDETVVSSPPVSRRLRAGEQLLAVGTEGQRAQFQRTFGG